MSRIAFDFRRPPILYRNQRAAGIGTVVRAGSMNNFFHTLFSNQFY